MSERYQRGLEHDGAESVLKSKSLNHHSRQNNIGKKIVSDTKTSDGQNIQNHSRAHMPKATEDIEWKVIHTLKKLLLLFHNFIT